MQKLPQCRELEKYFVKIFTVGGGVGGGDSRSVEGWSQSEGKFEELEENLLRTVEFLTVCIGGGCKK